MGEANTAVPSGRFPSGPNIHWGEVELKCQHRGGQERTKVSMSMYGAEVTTAQDMSVSLTIEG